MSNHSGARASPRRLVVAEPSKATLLHQVIETERDHLGGVIAVLQCLEVALQNGEDFLSGPYYAEAARVAIKMVAKSVDAFDPSHLPAVD